MAQKQTYSYDQLISVMEPWFAKAPALPANGIKGLVSAMPWIALIFGILDVLGALTLFGISPIGIFGIYNTFGYFIVSGVLTLIEAILLFMAYNGLRKLQFIGWKYAFWAQVVNVIAGLVVNNIVPTVIFGIIAFYLLYQIKPAYK